MVAALLVLCAVGVGIVAKRTGRRRRRSTAAPRPASGWSCTHNKRFNYYWCGAYYIPRAVRWQVPDGTPPAGGWPVAFYFAGTQPTDTASAFKRNFGEAFGVEYEPQILHELLDDPAGTGKRYAVIVADPPATGGWVQAWHTNVVFPYSASCDNQFFPDFFNEIKSGSYGPASQYNMNRRYAFGISSGGFNSSRMAVTFNSGSGNANTWKALGIVAASYATCSYTCSSVPTLPAEPSAHQVLARHERQPGARSRACGITTPNSSKADSPRPRSSTPAATSSPATTSAPPASRAWFDLY